MTRPDLVLRHARTSAAKPVRFFPTVPVRGRRTRFSLGPMLATMAVAAAVLVTAMPAPSGPTALGKVRRVAMSNQTMTNRAEYHPYYARKLGHRMTRNAGWRSDRQWHCLRHLWNLESSWHVHADNPSSSAYGIPQALPGRKMSSAGSHWRRNAQTQIRWGIRYVHSRYGTPCAAAHHKDTHGWY